jgi:hypothetical protein
MTQHVNTAVLDPLLPQTASPFRMWVQNLWIENCEERRVYKEDTVTMQQYWKTYKWWIKSKYRTHNGKKFS